MATSKIKSRTEIIREDGTGTTSASGNIVLPRPTGYSSAYPLSALILHQTTSAYIGTLCNMSGTLLLHVTKGDGTVIANTEVDYAVFWANHITDITT